MRLLIFLVAGALSFFALTGAAETQSVKTALHPLIGKWQWTRTENKCTEVYDFKADGTVPVTSGEEKTENTYRVSPEPDSGGFYQLTLKVNKDFGGKDCSDSDEDSTGQESTT